MKVDELLFHWEQDSKIDKTRLGDESLKTDQLHFKYTQMIIHENVRLAHLKNKYNEKYKELFEFYTKGAKTTKNLEELKKAPGGGIPNIQAEMHIQADPDFHKVTLELALQQEICNALKSIIWSVNKRHENIKNSILWEKFQAGG